MSEEKKVEVPAKFQALVEQIAKLSVLDLAELVKVLEEKFGVSAAAPMMMAAAAPSLTPQQSKRPRGQAIMGALSTCSGVTSR